MTFVFLTAVVLLIPVFDFPVQPVMHLFEHVCSLHILTCLEFRKTGFRALRIHVGAHVLVVIGADPWKTQQFIDGFHLARLRSVIVEVWWCR